MYNDGLPAWGINLFWVILSLKIEKCVHCLHLILESFCLRVFLFFFFPHSLDIKYSYLIQIIFQKDLYDL